MIISSLPNSRNNDIIVPMKGNNNYMVKIMGFIMKHSAAVLIAILLITVFFFINLFKLQMNADVFAYAAYAPPSEIITTPENKPKERLHVSGIDEDTSAIYPDRGEVVEVPERVNSILAEDLSGTSEFSPVEPIINEYEGDKGDGNFYDGYVIIFTSDRMFDPEVLNTIYDVRSNLEKRWEIGTCLSPFDYVTVEKKGSRLSVTPIAPVKPGETWTEEDAAIFRERLMNDSVAKNYLYTDDGSTIMIYYRARDLNQQSIAELDTLVNPLREYGHVALNGGGLINSAVMKYLNRDLITLLILCFAVILIVFYLSFRSLKSMLLPASLSLIGIIWTLGTMAIAGYQLTIVTILTPCLVLTLGSSYSIHMVSEYFETLAQNDKENLAAHFAKISKTIFFAMATTIAGFLSLLICRTPLFKDFGVTISIGVLYCAILAFTYLPAMLTRMKMPAQKKIKSVHDGILVRIIRRFSVIITEKWWIFLIITLLIIILFAFVNDKIGFDSNYMSYFPADDPIVKDSIYFAKTLGGTDPYYLTITAPDNESGFFLNHDNLKLVYAYESAIRAACPDIVQILSFSQYVSFLNEVYNGSPGIPDSDGLLNLLSRVLKQISAQIGSDVLNVLINEDASQITLSMRNYDSVEQDLQTTASARRLETVLDYYRYMLPTGTTSEIHCPASNGLRASDMIMVDQNRSTVLSMVIILILASCAVGSIKYGISALIPVMVGVMINYIFMWAAGIPFDIVTVGFSSVAIGSGIDDALHFIIRYRLKQKEHLALPTKELLKQNIIETGRPIILTSLSIDAGLIMLVFASYTPIQYFGILMCIALTAAMLATLCILPPTIILSDKIGEKLKKSH